MRQRKLMNDINVVRMYVQEGDAPLYIPHISR